MQNTSFQDFGHVSLHARFDSRMFGKESTFGFRKHNL